MHGSPLRSGVFATLVAAALVVPSPAGAGAGFTFFGSGYGHGIGMSQYGAYGLALDGWGPNRILKHYYTGVKVGRRDAPGKRFRVGLLQSRSGVTLELVSGAMRLSVGKKRIERVGSGSRRIEISGGRYRILREDGSLVRGRTWPARRPLRVRRAGVVRVAEWGHGVGRGALEIRRASSEAVHVVLRVKPEQYLYGLGEVPSSWPVAALKAQAIAGRTYAYRRVLSGGRTGCACDILGDTRDQAYVGWDKESGTAGTRWVRAVNRTARKVVLYDGAPISTLYSSSSGGFTEDSENVWGGSAVPYLRGTCDPGDYVAANPSNAWKVTLTSEQIAAALRARFGWDVAAVTGFVDKERGVSGRVVTITVKGTRSGGAPFSATASGWDLRGALGLKDSRFWVGSDLSVTGAIREAYDASGCAPGLPAGPRTATGAGAWQAFDQGRIYEKAGSAHLLSGPVLAEYLARGDAAGPLGFPTSGVTSDPDGTQRATFEGGTIACPPSGVCV